MVPGNDPRWAELLEVTAAIVGRRTADPNAKRYRHSALRSQWRTMNVRLAELERARELVEELQTTTEKGN